MAARNFVEILAQSIRDNWDKEAFSDYEGDTYTYEEVAGWIARFHIIFERNGLKKGDKVAFLGKNSRNWGISYMATTLYGAVAVPVLPDFHKDDIAHIVEHSDSKIFFCESGMFEKLEAGKFKHLDAVINLLDFGLISSNVAGYKKDIEDLNKLFANKYPEGLSPQNFVVPQVDTDDIVKAYNGKRRKIISTTEIEIEEMEDRTREEK